MTQEDETFRLLRKMTENEIIQLNQKWFRNPDDHRDWYDILYNEGGWTVPEWQLLISNFGVAT